MNKELLKFLLKLVGLYLLLYWFCILWIGLCAKGGYYWAFAENHLNFIKWYRELLLFFAVHIANLFGQPAVSNSTQMLIAGKGGINIVYDCVGYGTLSALTAIGVTLPNKRLKDRLKFITCGLLVFTFINSVRIFLIAFYAKEARAMNYDHHDIFNFICYLLLLGGVYWWGVKGLKINTEYKKA